jgi:hypothetical protein
MMSAANHEEMRPVATIPQRTVGSSEVMIAILRLR